MRIILNIQWKQTMTDADDPDADADTDPDLIWGEGGGSSSSACCMPPLCVCRGLRVIGAGVWLGWVAGSRGSSIINYADANRLQLINKKIGYPENATTTTTTEKATAAKTTKGTAATEATSCVLGDSMQPGATPTHLSLSLFRTLPLYQPVASHTKALIAANTFKIIFASPLTPWAMQFYLEFPNQIQTLSMPNNNLNML